MPIDLDELRNRTTRQSVLGGHGLDVVNMHGSDFDALIAELRTLRARVAEVEKNATRFVLKERDQLRCRAEAAEARIAEMERDARLGAVVRAEVANTNTYGHVPALDLAVRAAGARARGDYAIGYLLRAIADALRAEEGGEHG